MKKYIIYIGLIVLIFASFFISGLFFMNSGIIDFQKEKVNEDQGIKILNELDKLPLIQINAYEIIFNERGELIEINDNSITLAPFYYKDYETFNCKENLSDFQKGDKVRVYYNYLPEGGKELIEINKLD